MKVTAFIRKTAAKNNITDQARVYFRVRDIGGVDIKAASELSINPNHWSPERQGYKPRVALVSEEKKMGFDKDVQQITHLITKEYHRGVDGSWLKSLIEEYHRPGIHSLKSLMSSAVMVSMHRWKPLWCSTSWRKRS